MQSGEDQMCLLAEHKGVVVAVAAAVVVAEDLLAMVGVGEGLSSVG